MISEKIEKIRFFISIQWIVVGMICIGYPVYYLSFYIMETLADSFETFNVGMIALHCTTLSYGLLNMISGYRFITKRCLGIILGGISTMLTAFLSFIFIMVVSYESGLLLWLTIVFLFVMSIVNLVLLWKNKSELNS